MVRNCLKAFVMINLWIFSAVTSAQQNSQSQVNHPVVMIVAGQPVNQYAFDLMVKGRMQKGEPLNEDLLRKVREEIETQVMLAAEAKNKGYHQREDIVAQSQLYNYILLSALLVDDFLKKGPNVNELVKSEYSDKRAQGKIDEYHVRNILVKTEKQAQDLLQKLKKGSDFAKLATEYSVDPGADENGGDIGWMRPDIFADENFANEIKSLEKGEYSQKPVSTRWGWNLVKIIDGPRPAQNLLPWDQLQPELKKLLIEKKQRQILFKYLDSVKQDKEVKIVGEIKDPAEVQKRLQNVELRR